MCTRLGSHGELGLVSQVRVGKYFFTSLTFCRGEKKVICNKIQVQSAVTCLIWPPQQSSFVFGMADGKVKLGAPKGSKSQTLYNTGACTVSIALK